MLLEQSRRAFLAGLTGVASAGAVSFAKPTAETRSVRPSAQSTSPQSSVRWDTGWLDGFKGRHKQVYDLMWHTLRRDTLNPPMNYFDIHKEVSGLDFESVNVVVGANSTCFPINASDALWAKFKLGERYNITDPVTGKPAVRNVYFEQAAGGSGGSVKALQARGALFMMCNNSLLSIARNWSTELNKPASDLHAELAAGLNPGVRVVPALTWAVGMLQERGFTYEKL